MIRVNLLPDGKKRRSGGGLSFQLPSFGGGSGSGPWLLLTVLAPLVGLGIAGYLYYSVTAEQEEVQVALDAAVQDSIRFADIREQTDLLRARADSVTQRVGIIQEIDEGRYVWPHILDEVARALPDYTWLTALSQVSGGTEPIFTIQGQAGNPFALTVFMDQLEASPFVRNVSLVQTTQVVDQQSGQVVYDFELDAEYEQPPLDFLQTVPLFGEEVPREAPAGEETESGAGTG